MDIYISKAVASVVRICMDDYHDSDWRGRFYTRINKEEIPFKNMYEMLNLLGSFWDLIGFPQESTISRKFIEGKRKMPRRMELEVVYPEDGTKDTVKVEMSEIDMGKKHGEKGTFIVKIRYRQNATWQGHVTWVEENKTVPFRSALELMKLIDSTQEDETDDWVQE